MSIMDKSLIGLDEDLGLSYVSCIKVDGRPILPPLMDESKRAEMRKYREMAIAKELQRKDERQQVQKNFQASLTQNPEVFQFGSAMFTSTPLTSLHNSVVTSTSPLPARTVSRTSRFFDSTTTGNSTALELPIREQEPSVFVKFDTHFVIKSPYSSPGEVLDAPKMTTVIQIRQDEGSVPSAFNQDLEEESTSSSSGGNFASVGSSTGTFIIQSDPNKPITAHSSEDVFLEEESKSEDEIESIKADDEDEKDGNRPHKAPAPRSESSTPPYNRRKRPATYFDTDDEEEEKQETSQLSKLSSADTSLGKYLNPDVTWTSAAFSHPTVNESAASVDRSFDIRLSAVIPSSAEASPMSSKGGKPKTDSGEDSDKENQDEHKKKHVRRLSYTLSGPSDLLLATMNPETENEEPKNTAGDDFVEPPALSTIPSSNVTPVKLIPAHIENPTPSNHELDRRLDNLNRHLAELQLGMGLNKRKHLERYLGDMVATNNEVSSPAVTPSTDLETRLKLLQESQEKELAALAEKHRQQEAKLKQDLEALRSQSLAEVRVSPKAPAKSVKSPLMKSVVKNEDFDENSENSFYIPPPVSSIRSLSSGRQAPVPDASPGKQSTRSTSTASSAKSSRFSSVSNRLSTVPTPRERFYEQQQVTLTLTEGSTPSTISAANSVVSFGVHEGVGRVGLSNLQQKFKTMSPSMFKLTLDSRSPLLKGVVFLDPLDRHGEVRRIPNAALDPSMKTKFDRVSATVKGYLVRRLLQTERIQILIQTIRDTVDLLLKLYDEAPRDRNSSGFQVRPEEMDLNRRLLQQLHGACSSFHDVFFKLSTKERMAIIATDRAKLRAKAMKNHMSPSAKGMSRATMKSMERRMSVNPIKAGSRATRKTIVPDRDHLPLHVPSRYVHPPLGSQSVKAKPMRSYFVSPKRRRMTMSTSARSLQNSKPSTAGSTDSKANRSSASTTSSAASFKIKAKPAPSAKKELPSRAKKADTTYTTTTAKLNAAYRPRPSFAR